jgi:hypothetical protein
LDKFECEAGAGWGETGEKGKKEEFAGGASELLSPDLRCFWYQFGKLSDLTQEYGRELDFSNIEIVPKVLLGVEITPD